MFDRISSRFFRSLLYGLTRVWGDPSSTGVVARRGRSVVALCFGLSFSQPLSLAHAFFRSLSLFLSLSLSLSHSLFLSLSRYHAPPRAVSISVHMTPCPYGWPTMRSYGISASWLSTRSLSHPVPHGGVRPFHQKSNCLIKLT